MKITTIGGKLGLGVAYPSYDIRTLLTDSRSLESGVESLFFAIRTAGNDGHRFVGDLYGRGVRNFVVNRIPDGLEDAAGVNWFIVPDTVGALQKITQRDERFKGELLAITGSRGKTTLKEWLYQLMEPLSEISRSPRSYNSQIGVPLSMWDINPDSTLAIIEAGVSKSGEMKRLAETIQPDTVIITNLGSPHSEGFESLEQKGAEKVLLAEGERVKTVIYPYDQEIIRQALERSGGSDRREIGWSFTNRDASLYLETEVGGKVIYHWQGKVRSFNAPLHSQTDYENAAGALAFMLHSGIDGDRIAERFRNLHKIGTRLNVSEGINGCSVILDSYTSDFSSLRPALDFMRRRKIPRQSSTLILSDLHHEAFPSDRLYGEISSLIRRAGITRFIGVGKMLKENREKFPGGSQFFESSKELLQELSTSDFSDEIVLLKGSPEYELGAVAELLESRKHETVLEVNLDSVVANYNYFRSQLPMSCGLVCMVKASGYGAGSYEIAKTLQDCGAAYLAVAVLDEGIELRRQGITMPVMVMNPKVMNYRNMFAYNLEPEIYSFSMLEDVIGEARKSGIVDYPIHIKLDTGMHRTGFVEEELPRLMEIVGGTDAVKIRSLFSHLATADCPSMNDFTELQLSRFERYTSYILSHVDYPVLRHVLNSAGILRYPSHHYDLARLGIGLYGANTLPLEMEKPLAVVSTLRTIVIAIREYEAGETVGYGRWGRIERRSRIATLPIGYADGMNRHFGRGNIRVMVNGKEAPTIGNICMDACMIDVTGIDCEVGDSVEIFGRQMPLQRLADVLDTIPYEILTSISPRVKRVYYRE